jgi:cytochrome c oxidase subunit 2
MSLEYGTTQVIALVAFLLIALGFVGVFVVVALASRFELEFERVRGVGYAVRKPWLVFLVVVIALALAIAAFFLPYASGAADDIEVRVVGGQFYWSLSKEEFSRGEDVRFAVTSADVNHGFGLYDPNGKLIGSVQAMPGYTNRLSVTLDVAGRYTIACFEFCGLDHHEMIREFEVRP